MICQDMSVGNTGPTCVQVRHDLSVESTLHETRVFLKMPNTRHGGRWAIAKNYWQSTDAQDCPTLHLNGSKLYQPYFLHEATISTGSPRRPPQHLIHNPSASLDHVLCTLISAAPEPSCGLALLQFALLGTLLLLLPPAPPPRPAPLPLFASAPTPVPPLPLRILLEPRNRLLDSLDVQLWAFSLWHILPRTPLLTSLSSLFECRSLCKLPALDVLAHQPAVNHETRA
jgi:hypothetical protein